MQQTLLGGEKTDDDHNMPPEELVNVSPRPIFVPSKDDAELKLSQSSSTTDSASECGSQNKSAVRGSSLMQLLCNKIE